MQNAGHVFWQWVQASVQRWGRGLGQQQQQQQGRRANHYAPLLRLAGVVQQLRGATMAILCCISSMRGTLMLSSGLSRWLSFWGCSTLHSSVFGQKDGVTLGCWDRAVGWLIVESV